MDYTIVIGGGGIAVVMVNNNNNNYNNSCSRSGGGGGSNSSSSSRGIVVVVAVVVVVVVVAVVVVVVVISQFVIRVVYRQGDVNFYLPSKIQSIFVRIESLVPPNGNKCELINYVYQPLMNIQCLVLTGGYYIHHSPFQS